MTGATIGAMDKSDDSSGTVSHPTSATESTEAIAMQRNILLLRPNPRPALAGIRTRGLSDRVEQSSIEIQQISAQFEADIGGLTRPALKVDHRR